MLLEFLLIFKIEKKKRKNFFLWKKYVNSLRKKKHDSQKKRLFFGGKTTVNPLRKKNCAGKTKIALGHLPGF
jgi:hypothetical protein